MNKNILWGRIYKDFVSFSGFLWFKIQKVEERKKGMKKGKKEEWKERRKEGVVKERK